MPTPADWSNNTSRCDFARLHRSPSYSPDLDECRKRKRQETTPQALNTTTPATKKRRDRPERTPATPRRYRAAQDQDPDQSQEASDAIMVRNSIIAANDNDKKNEGVANNNPSHTTSIVRETPLDEQPGLEVAEHQNQYVAFVRQATDHENPFINRPPVFTQLGGRLRSARSENERDNVHYTTRVAQGPQIRDYEEEAHGLRESRAGLRENLVASTALVHTLQNTLLRRDGDEADIRSRLARAETDLAEAQARAQAGLTSVLRLRSTLAMFVAGVAVYAVWIWVNGPEMEYVRKRRADVLMD